MVVWLLEVERESYTGGGNPWNVSRPHGHLKSWQKVTSDGWIYLATVEEVHAGKRVKTS